ncbi:MAG: hypothetical protein R2761_29475 [Acidimicrobiales bacterium]
MADPAPDLDGFYRRFTAWGADATIDGYVDLFDPSATLFDSGMPEPLPASGIRALITRTLGLLEGFRFEPVRHGRSSPEHGADTLFLEARNSAVLAGEPITWPAVYAVTVRGDRVLRGRRYYDQAAILPAAMAAALPAEHPHPDAGPVSLRPVSVGMADDGWFREWTGTVAPQGTPVRFDAVERHAGGETVWFYNSLVLRPAAAAAMADMLASVTGSS